MTQQPKRICLLCGADRQELESMLHEPEVITDNIHLRSENHTLALIAIEKCPDCRRAFEPLFKGENHGR